MEWVRSYILTLAAAGILCAIVKNLSAGRAGERMVALACGAFLVLAAVSPVYTVDLSHWDGDLSGLRLEAAALEEDTKKKLQEQLDAVIEAETRTYILDKGTELGASLAVEVSLTENEGYNVPESVTISGDYSPYMKSRLSSLLESELGIPKERQEWS